MVMINVKYFFPIYWKKALNLLKKRLEKYIKSEFKKKTSEIKCTRRD